MNRRRWLCALPAAFTASPSIASAAMPAIPPTLQPRPLRPALHISSLRFAVQAGPPTLAGLGAERQGEWPLWSLDAPDQAPPLMLLPSPFGPPSWDLAGSSAGPAAVWSRPGSAVTPLWTRVAGHDPSQQSSEPKGVNGGPRLARGGRAGGVTAVTEAGGENRLALILRRDTPQRLLPDLGRGRLIAGRLVQHGGRPWLFALCLPPGARWPERPDLAGESLPAGVLHVAPLDDGLALAGAAQQPFGDDRIYEFDVDSTGTALVVVATAARGWRVARGPDASGAWSTTAEAELETALLSPALLAAGDAVQVAMLQAVAGSAPRLLRGRI